MEYRAVKNRCVVDLDSLRLPISNEEALDMLLKKGFRAVEVDITGLARRCTGTSGYRRGARLSEAPATVDCSSFIKWLYGERGIWLPRRSIQQREHGQPVLLGEIIENDAVFASGSIDYYHDDPADGVGHVGLATGIGTVIHAANGKVGVVESPLKSFIDGNKFRGARRFIPKNKKIITLETPADREIETADDIKWVILQSLPKK